MCELATLLEWPIAIELLIVDVVDRRVERPRVRWVAVEEAPGLRVAAASTVLESACEPGAYAGDRTTAMSEAELQRILDGAGVDAPPAELHPLAWLERRGSIHLPLDAVVAVARAFAAAEPQAVRYVDDAEADARKPALRQQRARRCEYAGVFRRWLRPRVYRAIADGSRAVPILRFPQ